MNKLSSKLVGAALGLIGLLAISGFFAAAAEAAAPAPAWKVIATAQPTIFEPGSEAGAPAADGLPEYFMAATNVGAANVDGTAEAIVVTATLPTGTTPAAASEPIWTIKPRGTSGPCAVAGQVITCEVGETVEPGNVIDVNVPVDVAAEPPASLSATFAIGGGLALPAEGTATAPTGTVPAPFGFLAGDAALGSVATEVDGTAATLAGAHPFFLTLQTGINSYAAGGSSLATNLFASGALRRLRYVLPTGMVVNPNATPTLCSEAQLASTEAGEGCSPGTQIGTVRLTQGSLNLTQLEVPLYNLQPPPGEPAEFGFDALGTLVHVGGGLDGSLRLSAESSDILAKLGIVGIETLLWGNPSDPRHDSERVGLGCQTIGTCGSVEPGTVPLLTSPSACSGPLPFSGEIGSWEDFSAVDRREVVTTSPSGEPVGVEGCGQLQFNPTVTVQATSHAAESPTGLDVHLHIPQGEGVNGRATANLKKVVVKLPQGMTVNPPAAEGLGACSPAQIGIGNSSPQNCPNSARVGSAEVQTPLLKSPLKGSVYLAEQRNNPFGTLLALYLVVEGEGIVIKLPGRVDANSADGQLTATFDNNPELPFSDLEVDFNSGSRATMVTPASCGSYSAGVELTSWASATPVASSSSIPVTEGCSTGGFSPGLSAGVSNPVAGAYSPFTLRVTRADGEQNLSRIAATLPKGLLAKLAGVPLCPEAGAAAGNCPADAQIGSTTTGVGAGTQPLFIPQAGKSPTAIYLAGPYHGAPYSLVVRVPAQAGPFDLGTIAVRVALEVDPFTAQVTASSDPLPQILEGIPVSYRDVRVAVTRPNFVLNPTSCEPMQLTSVLTSIAGKVAKPASRFQVAGCGSLAFKPKLQLSLKGSTKRTGFPAVKAVVTYPKQGAYANIARAQVNLPHSEFFEQNNLDKICTKPVLLEGKCPKKTIYGKARAVTPLLDKPLEGPVYVVGGFGYKLPALVADLNGQIRVLLKGKVDSGPNGGIRNTFEAVPDAPVSKFVLELKGGKNYGLLINSENLCKKPQHAIVRFTAQNGLVDQTKPVVGNQCGKKSKK
jgi:hypothetical protein